MRRTQKSVECATTDCHFPARQGKKLCGRCAYNYAMAMRREREQEERAAAAAGREPSDLTLAAPELPRRKP